MNRDRLAEATASFDGADVTFCCVDLTKVHRGATVSPVGTRDVASAALWAFWQGVDQRALHVLAEAYGVS